MHKINVWNTGINSFAYLWSTCFINKNIISFSKNMRIRNSVIFYFCLLRALQNLPPKFWHLTVSRAISFWRLCCGAVSVWYVAVNVFKVFIYYMKLSRLNILFNKFIQWILLYFVCSNYGLVSFKVITLRECWRMKCLKVSNALFLYIFLHDLCYLQSLK